MYTISPSQIGFVPSGSNQSSEFIVGRNVSSYEGIGLGPNARPDIAEKITFYLTRNNAGIQTKIGTVSIDATGLYAITQANPNAPSHFLLTMKQVLVCDGSTAKNMVILASQTYPTGAI